MEEGLKTISAINLDTVQTVARDRIGRYLGAIGVRRKAELRERLRFALELDESSSPQP